MLSQHGIDPNPEKISAIMNMRPPTKLLDVQKLMGYMAALSQFISRLGMRRLPFLKLLKKQDAFKWTQEAQEAFEDLKGYLLNPPTLVAPYLGEVLQLYISATNSVVSTAIVVERKEDGSTRKVQHPVYFISEVLNESKTRHSRSRCER